MRHGSTAFPLVLLLPLLCGKAGADASIDSRLDENARAVERLAERVSQLSQERSSGAVSRAVLTTGEVRVPSGERFDQLAGELDATKAELGEAKAKLAAHEALISELSAKVAQQTAAPGPGGSPMDLPVEAYTTTAARQLTEAAAPSLVTQTCSSTVSENAQTGGRISARVDGGDFVDLFITGSTVRRNGQTDTYTDLAAATSTVTLRSYTSDGWCLDSISYGGVAVNLCHANVWLDSPCSETDTYAGSGRCVTTLTFDVSSGISDQCLPPPPPPQPPPSPPQPPPLPPPLLPLPPSPPPLPATANELRIAGRHTAIALNANVEGMEPFRCTAVGDGRLTCSGEVQAADFRTASGISLEELARFAGFVPPPSPPPPASPPIAYAVELNGVPITPTVYAGAIASHDSIIVGDNNYAALSASDLGNFGISNFEIEVRVQALGAFPESYGVLFVRSQQVENPFTGPTSFLYSDGAVKFRMSYLMNDCKAEGAVSNWNQENILRYTRTLGPGSCSTLKIFVNGVEKKSCQDCAVLDTSHFTTSEMWIAGNHGDHSIQSLNMRITQLRLTTNDTSALMG